MYTPTHSEPWLVTGATGFIGHHIMTALLEAGIPVRALVRLSRNLPETWPADVEVIRGDVTFPASLAEACTGVGTVVHSAGFAHTDRGKDTDSLHQLINFEGTKALVDEALSAGVSHFILLSTVKAVGPPRRSRVNEDWPVFPDTEYGRAKRQAEEYLLAAATQAGIHATVLRPALVYGCGVKGNLKALITKIARVRPAILPGITNQRSLIHVEDLTQAILLAARNPRAAGRVYNVTDGQTYSTTDILNAACHAIGTSPKILPLPRFLTNILAQCVPVTDKIFGYADYDSTRIHEELGFTPQNTLQSCMSEMVDECLRLEEEQDTLPTLSK
ncbi:NAD-dependent epimerase/dehydratase family protein [Desulfovibrio inopinatus]|uniref:NAD-dependent epimerase/dehydratase family protein n=1 Tax=Desulfovibrio inopinatus TaxID=102109 RepID=UPI000420FC70|nr:NAD-dependent epimerase/dehydratase family protein [Desulfovibrio inopinatus]